MQVDILSEYLHMIPINLKPSETIAFMEYILLVEGTGWKNKFFKISIIRSKFAFEENIDLSLNPDGDSE